MSGKKYMPMAAVTLGLVFSFFLPNAVASVMDAKMLGNYKIIGIHSFVFEAEPVLSLPERIALVASPGAELLSLASGQAMNMETAKSRAAGEVEKLFRDRILEFSIDDCVVEDGTAVFLAEAENPTVNMIIWEFRITDWQGNEVIVTIDDETSTILKLIYQQRSHSLNLRGTSEDNGLAFVRDDMYLASLSLSEMMTDYYGQPVRLGDYHLSSGIAYYRGDMYTRGLVIPMYGVVRGNSFTINERP